MELDTCRIHLRGLALEDSGAGVGSIYQQMTAASRLFIPNAVIGRRRVRGTGT